MGTQFSSAYCSHCDDQVKIERQTPNHILHLILSIVTGGLWVIAWVIIASDKKPWRCSRCGKSLGGGSNGWGVIGSALSKGPQKEGPAPYRCPFCREEVRPDATLCKHCGNKFGDEKWPVQDMPA